MTPFVVDTLLWGLESFPCQEGNATQAGPAHYRPLLPPTVGWAGLTILHRAGPFWIPLAMLSLAFVVWRTTVGHPSTPARGLATLIGMRLTDELTEGDMLARLSRLLQSWARGRLILALIAAFVIFEVITLPRLQAAPGGDIVSLDAQLFYRPEQAFATVADYGDARGFWISVYLTWDIANPVLYTLIFNLLISWLFRRGFKPESKLQRLNVLPVGAGICDLFENLCIVTLLAVYPVRPAAVAWLSTICTMSKMGFLSVSALLILVGLIDRRRAVETAATIAKSPCGD